MPLARFWERLAEARWIIVSGETRDRDRDREGPKKRRNLSACCEALAVIGLARWGTKTVGGGHAFPCGKDDKIANEN